MNLRGQKSTCGARSVLPKANGRSTSCRRDHLRTINGLLCPCFLIRDRRKSDCLLLFIATCVLFCIGANVWLSVRVNRLQPKGPLIEDPCPDSSSESDSAKLPRDLPRWILPFNGSNFMAYKQSVDRRIDDYRYSLSLAKEPCYMPLFSGEYGYELAAIVPWAYHKRQVDNCGPITEGVEGTKYLYFFSQRHTIVNDTYVVKHVLKLTKNLRLFPYRKKVKLRRRYQDLPDGNPFNKTQVHMNDTDFPQKDWLAPPFKDFYRRDDAARTLGRPLVVLFNKYTEEWEKRPLNFLPLKELREALDYLTRKYHVVYVRLEHKILDDHSKSCRFGDKDMIRATFPGSAVVLDDLMHDLSPDEVNLLIFSLASLSDRFVSVLGGNAVVASFFGGRNIILAKNGTELEEGDYTYYHRFSNAAIDVVNNERDLIRLVKRWM